MAEWIPHEYQSYCVNRVVNEPCIGLMLDMGLGKTAIMLQAITRLVYDDMKAKRVLVIAPKKVAEATWQEEAQKWEQFHCLRLSTVMGTVKQRQKSLQTVADVYITNRDNVAWLVNVYYRKNVSVWPFDMVVVDESSSFKNRSSIRFKALERMLPAILRMVLLTGTPAPNGCMDLWAQMYLLDKGKRLGRTLTAFRDTYFNYNPYRHEYTEKAGTFDTIQRKIGDICVSMSASDYLKLPDLLFHDFPVSLDDGAKKVYSRMEKTFLLSVEEAEVTAVTAGVLTNKLLQLCSGSVYDDMGNVLHIHDCKTEALSELIEQLHGEHALIFYAYQHEIDRIQSVIRVARPTAVIRELQSAEDVTAWNEGSVDFLLAHPASAAYGLNMQKGGHNIIWFTLPWSLELYQQANARLHRQGQIKPVTIHRMLVKDGMDEQVLHALQNKDRIQDTLLQSIKAKIQKLKGGNNL